MKSIYRCKLVNHILLLEIEENLLNLSSTATKVSARVNLLQAIQFIINSWGRSKTTIKNCFARCGFSNPEEEPENMQGHDSNMSLQQVENYQEFM